VWSYCVVCVEILTLDLPYAKAHPGLAAFDVASDVGRRQLRPWDADARAHAPPQFAADERLDGLLTACCEFDPSERPAFDEIVRRLSSKSFVLQ
jgi:Protein tyrosine and serine/threonine kinase